MGPSNARSSKVFILCTCSLAIFSDILFYSVLPPILPTVLERRIKVKSNQVQLWTSLLPAIYSISIVISAPIAGLVSDRSSLRRPLLLSGLVFQAVGLALLMVGTSLGLWIGGLIIVGLSSGIVWTSSLALAVDVVDEDNLAEHMGFVGISVSCGLFLGTTLSGIVFDAAGYYAVWAMCYGLVGLDAVLRLTMIEPRKTRVVSPPTEERTNTRREDVESSSTVCAQDKESQSSLPPVMLLWRLPWFVAMLLITVLDATLPTTFDGALAIHLQNTFGYNTRGVGLTYISLVIPTFLAPYIGRCADRHGAHIILTTTFLLGSIPLICLRFVDHDTLQQKVLVCALLALMGLFAAGRLGIYSAQLDHSVAKYARENPDSVSHENAIA